jgi:beta-xylosidase
MIEAVKIWNEPNNLSHWDFELDRGWKIYGETVRAASQAIAAERPALTRVLGGISPIDPGFVRNMREQGVLEWVDAVAVHGFPLDWNHWPIHEWPDRLAEIRAETDLPIWITEVGVSTFGAEEVQEFGLRRTAELIMGRAPRIHWYSLYDLPRAWPATTRQPRSGRSVCLPSSRQHSGSASGSTSKIIGSTRPSGSCVSSACGICAPGSAGPTAFVPARWPGSTGRCARWSRSR